MEKISGIVKGSSRITAVSNDAKGATAARPGAPALGRSVGESNGSGQAIGGSTASRAVALHNGLNEMKKANIEARIAARVADNFFMKSPHEEMELPGVEEEVTKEVLDHTAPPEEYTPRGSYIDVRA